MTPSISRFHSDLFDVGIGKTMQGPFFVTGFSELQNREVGDLLSKLAGLDCCSGVIVQAQWYEGGSLHCRHLQQSGLRCFLGALQANSTRCLAYSAAMHPGTLPDLDQATLASSLFGGQQPECLELGGFGSTSVVFTGPVQSSLLSGRRRWRIFATDALAASYTSTASPCAAINCFDEFQDSGQLLVLPLGWSGQCVDEQRSIAVRASLPCSRCPYGVSIAAPLPDVSCASSVSRMRSFDGPVQGLNEQDCALVDACFRHGFEKQRAAFLREEAADRCPGVRPPVPVGPSRLRCVWWMSLARREDRRADAERALSGAGLVQIAERIEAVDGRGLDLNAVSAEVALADAVAEARQPPARVVGLQLTRGALGLLSTWYDLLSRAECQLQPHECALIAEDDARYAPDFLEALGDTIRELDAFDPRWQGLQLGYYAGGSRLIALPGASGHEFMRLRQPLLTFGCVGVLVRSFGAKAIRQGLFPVGPGEQLDTAFNHHYGHLRVYATAAPLMAAVPSECGDTDIQILTDALAERMHQEEVRRNITPALTARGTLAAPQSPDKMTSQASVAAAAEKPAAVQICNMQAHAGSTFFPPLCFEVVD